MEQVSPNVTRRHSRQEVEARFTIAGLKTMAAAGDLWVQRAQEKAPVDTGRLFRSIHRSDPYQIGKAGFAVRAGSNVEYARAQEFGSGIHAEDPAARELILIEAGFWTGKSNKKSLAFKWPAGDRSHPAYNADLDMFFFRRVYHPGVPARRYLRDSRDEIKAMLVPMFISALTAELA